ncbi:MAG: hypothetical protein EPO07_05435 [Verrucomicrobia bacterium]|nr:MAG: hypothetical protein EPO07_05435 [Verrucomicrobiota bacterium]
MLTAQDAGTQPRGGHRPPPPDGPPGPGMEGHRPPPPPVLVVLDANHDGVIDAGEIANASKALLQLDKNGDGQLTREELRPPFPPPEGGDGPDGPPPFGPPDGD